LIVGRRGAGAVTAARYRSAMPSGGARNLQQPANIEVRRSARRRRTVSAYRDGDRTVVLLPARMTRAEEQRWVEVMLERLAAQERRRAGRAGRTDAELAARAAELSQRYLDGAARPRSVRWVSNQACRWGSCTPADATIRLSDRLRIMPSWVVDYVLVHELAHLLETGHGPRFARLVDRYPKAERARGYLLGVSAGVAEPGPAPGCGADPDGEPEGLW
jgi:predicted metal-dependent hydrolase